MGTFNELPMWLDAWDGRGGFDGDDPADWDGLPESWTSDDEEEEDEAAEGVVGVLGVFCRMQTKKV